MIRGLILLPDATTASRSLKLPELLPDMTRVNCDKSITCCRKLSRVAKRLVRFRRFQPEMSGVGSFTKGVKSMPLLKSPPSHFMSVKHMPCRRVGSEQYRSGGIRPMSPRAQDARSMDLTAMQRPNVGL